jgi:hypothetical protein
MRNVRADSIRAGFAVRLNRAPCRRPVSARTVALSYRQQVDRRAAALLERFAAAAGHLADEIAEASMREVPAFAAMNDPRLRAEIRDLAAQHVSAFALAARTGTPPPAEVLVAARERAVMRARQMVPLSAMLHSHLIAQRIISAALTSAADSDAASRGIALEMIARTFDYNIAVTAATADAYLDIVQGDMLDLNAARGAVIDAAVSGAAGLPELTRRAAALGLAPDHRYALALIRPAGAADTAYAADGIGDVARAIARATGRAERTAFVILRDEEILAVLDAHGPRRAPLVLGEAFGALASRALMPHAGIGRAFAGLAELPASYRDARRALRHANDDRPVLCFEDLRLFDELTLARDDAADLIPVVVRETLTQRETRLSLDAYVEANLSIAEAAARLNLHPNSLRYRLRRIAELTGLDPTRMSDLLELLAASRLMHDKERGKLRAVSMPSQDNQR